MKHIKVTENTGVETRLWSFDLSALFGCCHFRRNRSSPILTNDCLSPLSFLFRLPDHDRRLVLRVCVRGRGRQEVPGPGSPGCDESGAYCTSCLGSDGSPGVNTEIQVLAPTSGLFDSALFLGCFYLFNISPTPPSKTASSSRQNNKDFVFFFTGLPVYFVYLHFSHRHVHHTVASFPCVVFWANGQI